MNNCSGDHFFFFLLHSKKCQLHIHIFDNNHERDAMVSAKNSFRNDDSGIPVVGYLKDMEFEIGFCAAPSIILLY